MQSSNVFATSVGVNTLLYLLYGKAEEFHLELTHSVCTAIASCADAPIGFRIVLACDEDNHRDDLPVELLTISQEELNGWTFGGRFGHGAKVGVLKKAAEVYGGKVALIDTDTWFLKCPSEILDRIDERNVVMHRDEGPLAGHGQLPTYRALMAQHSGRYRFDENSHMFNSGVVGISSEQARLLDDAAQLTAELVEDAGPIHTFEQFSLGIVLGSHFNVRGADDIVRHYTGWKRRFVRARIREIEPEFTQAGFDRALSARGQMDELPRRRPVDVIRSRLKGWQRRTLNDYDSAYLCHLSAFAAPSPAEANAWAGTALDFIDWNNYPRDVVAADFGKMAADQLGALDWLEPRVRERWTDYWREVTTTSRDVP